MESLPHLGLWGDGDEVDAINEAFRAINLKVPVKDAPNWVTVGDLWQSVTRVAPELANSQQSWDDFRRGLSINTYVDWTQVSAETKLLDGMGYTALQRIISTVRKWWHLRHA